MNNNIRICSFLYHEVTNNPKESGFQRKSALPYKHTEEEFLNNITEILNSDIKMSNLNMINFNSNEKYNFMTFDDGGKSAMKISKILDTFGWKGHFFVTTSMIGKKGFLSKKDIIDIDSRGHIIGSHSHSHPDPFYFLSFQEMFEEWKISKKILEKILNKNIISASIPGGEMNEDSKRSASKAGIKYLFTSEPFLKPKKLDSMLYFGRVCPKKGTNLKYVRSLSNHRGFFKEMLIRKIKNFVKFYIYYPATFKKTFKRT